MNFAEPSVLLWLWGAPAVGLFLWVMYRRRVKKIRKLVDDRLRDTVAGAFHERGYLVKSIFLVAVVIFSVIALARPRWGYEWQEIKRQGLDIMLVVDVSKSMLTADVKPSRLARTKLAAQDLIKKLRGDRIGLVAFAGDAFVACPLTVDYRGFLLSLNDLTPETIPRGGTNVAQAIKEAIGALEGTASKFKVIIIVTDGESLEGDPQAMAREAKEAGIKIYTVGVGTPEGELIRVPDGQGQTGFLKDPQGNVVKSRLNQALLREIAAVTGGAYAQAAGAQFGLEFLYDRYISRLEKRDIKEDREKQYFERFQIPVMAALIFLVAEVFISTRKKI